MGPRPDEKPGLSRWSSGRVVASAAAAAFGRPLVTNVARGLLVEAIVAEALAPDWKWCAADYAPYDFIRLSEACGRRMRLEVKQSSLLQSWLAPQPSTIRWDVRPRSGYYDGARWVAQSGRKAEIYILAAHLETQRQIADHRDPLQWRFFVLDAIRLRPDAKSIGRAAVEAMVPSVSIEELASMVEVARVAIDAATRASIGDLRSSAPAAA